MLYTPKSQAKKSESLCKFENGSYIPNANVNESTNMLVKKTPSQKKFPWESLSMSFGAAGLYNEDEKVNLVCNHFIEVLGFYFLGKVL